MHTVQDDYVGDGTTTQFGVSFPYLEPADVNVIVDGVVVATTFVGPSTVEILPAPAAGASVRILRRTDIDLLNYEFQLGAAFLPRYIDSNNKQLLYAVQEGRAVASDAATASTAALEAAEYAVIVADSAEEVASSAAGDAARASADAAAALAAVEASGVGAFNGRSGLVYPMLGDYSADMVTWSGITVGDALDLLAVRQTGPTGAAEIPAGTVADRPSLAKDGLFRYNTETGTFEGLQNGEWGSIGGSSDHALSVKWEASRNNIGDGYAAADGQLLSRATYPAAWEAIAAGRVPVTTEAEWLADPSKRGMFTTGDGATTFRLPDYNGKFAGSLGAVFLRGDGTRSAGEAGLIQADAFQGHRMAAPDGSTGFDTRVVAGGDRAFAAAGANLKGTQSTGDPVSDGANGTPRTASETRPLNVTGCWVIKLFGAVVNVGSADAAQLASDYANLSASLQTLDSQIDFTIIYPNGGSEASPANVAANSRYVENNPFPGHRVLAVAEVLYGGKWGAAPLTTPNASGTGIGISAYLLNDEALIVQTGGTNLMASSNLQGNPFNYSGLTLGNLPCRVLVWRIKGAVA